MGMRRFNPGPALIFLLILVVAIVAISFTHQRVEGRYQAEMGQIAGYGLDEWIEVLGLEEFLGDPPVTPFPAEQLPVESAGTPTPGSEDGGG